ncbi:RNA polymerase sigma factor [Alicyclobacillus dauci]|uniref:RNA polymerase sigma factor n=1 Tax=Alicyclobacillus dauci TaxID=1475485 RepID=A0ABY6Z525_9BACL|nr:RNA polymerase sigma factor [Alicyclobacillus dauci]WAH37768.1 RNA polymerase sigma factor [Alicyclobacillus dauci]
MNWEEGDTFVADDLSTTEAIRQLFDLYADDVYRIARFTLGCHEDAKDAVQEIFLRVVKSYDGFRREANAKTWLLRIARNYLTDIIRKRQTERNYLKDYQPPYLGDETNSAEIAIELEQALLQLKHNYRTVFVLRHVQHLTTDEIANVLGWSNARVRTTLHRAILQLRSLLDESDTEVGDRR